MTCLKLNIREDIGIYMIEIMELHRVLDKTTRFLLQDYCWLISGDKHLMVG